MLTHCHHWELGKSLPGLSDLDERLKQIGHSEALLILSRTSFPSQWPDKNCYTLLNGPSRFVRAYTNSALATKLAQETRAICFDWITQIHKFRQIAERNEIPETDPEYLIKSILAQLNREEKDFYPVASGFLKYPRIAQSLVYEHDGIRRYLGDLVPTLKALPSLSMFEQRRLWSRFALNLIHLIEHHIEHEASILAIAEATTANNGQGTGFVTQDF